MGQVTMPTEEFASLINTLAIVRNENVSLKKRIKKLEKMLPPTEQDVDAIPTDNFQAINAKEEDIADPPIPTEKNSLASKVNDIEFGSR